MIKVKQLKKQSKIHQSTLHITTPLKMNTMLKMIAMTTMAAAISLDTHQDGERPMLDEVRASLDALSDEDKAKL